MAIRIVIFEDNHKLRESISFLLNHSDKFEVVGEYEICIDAANITKALQPDVVLMDIDMPGETGNVGIEKVKHTKPDTAVIVYTVFEDDENLFKCLCAGASGYLLKKTPPEKLFTAIEEVIEGGAPMSPGIAKRIMQSFHKINAKETYNLSVREVEVLKLLSEGYSIKMIAAKLFLAFDTIRSHLKNIYTKLQVSSGKEAITKAFNEKII